MNKPWQAKTSLNQLVSDYWDKLPYDEWTTDDIYGLAYAVAAWQRERDAKIASDASAELDGNGSFSAGLSQAAALIATRIRVQTEKNGDLK